MDNYSITKSRLNNLTNQIERLRSAISSMPEGSLHISKSGKYYTWRVLYPDGSRRYLPKEDETMARQLALKNSTWQNCMTQKRRHPPAGLILNTFPKAMDMRHIW